VATGPENEVLLKLVAKGMNPAEAQRIASQTHQALEAELRASMGRQVAAHRAAADATTKEAKKAAEAQIRETTKATQALTVAFRQVEAEAKKAAASTSVSWRRTMEDLENFTVVAMGAFTVMKGGFERFKALGEEVIRTTNIFSSLKGSIDEARAAVEGTISDMDLIIGKNQLMESGLEISDKQFADVAFAADRYADAVGISASDALTKMTAGLAAGNEKMLKKINILIDSKKAEQDYGVEIGKTVEMMTEEEKRAGFVAEALKRIGEQAKKVNDIEPTFASNLETGFVHAENAWDRLMAKIGGSKGQTLADQDLEQVDSYDYTPAAEARRDRNRKILAARRRREQIEAEAFRQRMDSAGAEAGLLGMGGAIESAQDPYIADRLAEGSKKSILSSEKKAVDDRYDLLLDYERDAKLRFDAELLKIVGKPIEGEAEADLTRADRAFAGGNFSREAYTKGMQESKAAANQRTVALGTKGFDTDAYAKAMGEAAQAQASLEARMQETKERAGGGLLASLLFGDGGVEKTYELIDGAFVEKEGEGGGLLGRMLFGPGGPEKTYAQMDQFERSVIDSLGLLSDAGQGMADAFGQAFASAVQGEKGFKAAMAENARAVLKSLVAQAASQAIMQTALGLANLAIGNFAAAGLNFSSAATFGAVAGVSAVGLAALGPSPSKGGRPTESRSQTFATAPTRSSNDNGGGRSPIIINVTVNPGGEAEAGRAVLKALEAYKAQSGRDIVQVLSAA
jgi:hypothetical protein